MAGAHGRLHNARLRASLFSRMIKSWLIHSLALWVTAQFLPGFSVKGFWGALKVSALFGLLNLLLGWLIYHAIGIASLGLGYLFAFVTRTLVNAILLKVTDSFSASLEIKGFTPALLGALCISAIGTLAEVVMRHPGYSGWY
jgi:putative membrane protein